MTMTTKENNRPAIIIMASAAGVYLAIYFWYFAIPILLIAVVIFYVAYKKNPKLQMAIKDRTSGLWGKLKRFMTR